MRGRALPSVCDCRLFDHITTQCASPRFGERRFDSPIHWHNGSTHLCAASISRRACWRVKWFGFDGRRYERSSELVFVFRPAEEYHAEMFELLVYRAMPSFEVRWITDSSAYAPELSSPGTNLATNWEELVWR
jgi:hypothetical protein